MGVIRYWPLTVVCLVSLAGPALWGAAADPAAVRPVVAGSRLPEATVVGADGTSVPLREAVGGGKTVLVVYRGGWCPFCTRHFAALGQARAELEARGWKLVAISPDSPASIAAWVAEHGEDGVARFSDGDADAIEALGLGFTVDRGTLEKYRGYGIDLERASGHDHHILPVPAVLLVVDDEIRWLHADADYRRRVDRGLLLAAIEAVERSLVEEADRP